MATPLDLRLHAFCSNSWQTAIRHESSSPLISTVYLYVCFCACVCPTRKPILSGVPSPQPSLHSQGSKLSDTTVGWKSIIGTITVISFFCPCQPPIDFVSFINACVHQSLQKQAGTCIMTRLECIRHYILLTVVTSHHDIFGLKWNVSLTV